MADSTVLERITGHKNSVRPADVEAESEQVDLGTFGWLRGSRDRAVMLELRKKSGDVQAHAYSWLQKIELDPSMAITLWFPGQKVVIHGRGLSAEARPGVRLFEGLTRHKVLWIRECDSHSAFRSSENTTVVERIDW